MTWEGIAFRLGFEGRTGLTQLLKRTFGRGPRQLELSRAEEYFDHFTRRSIDPIA